MNILSTSIAFLVLVYVAYKVSYEVNKPTVALPRQHTVGVILLNYKRPHNLKSSLPRLSSYSLLDHIVVSHGHPDFADASFEHPKVSHMMDFENNDLYGGARRFINAAMLDTDFVLFLDDDIIPEEHMLAEMYNAVLRYDTIAGPISRSCTSNGYGQWHPHNAVLTPALMCRRSFVEDYMRNAFPKFRQWLVDHHGNCEDLSFNAYLRQTGKQPYIAKYKDYTELDISDGYHAGSDHFKIRSEFCRLHFS